ncbi:unnamed protein product [Heterobilharzia americana]|nr:unnamed protein product [Heterobilharzia americana]
MSLVQDNNQFHVIDKKKDFRRNLLSFRGRQHVGFINQGFGLYFSSVISYQLYLDPFISLLFNIVFITGGFFGNIIYNYTLHKYTYEWSVYLMYISSIIGWSLMCLIEVYENEEIIFLICLFIGHFFIGLYVGISFNILPIIFHTILPSRWKYTAYSFPCFMINFSVGISFLLTVVFSWILNSWFCLLFSIFGFIISLNLHVLLNVKDYFNVQHSNDEQMAMDHTAKKFNSLKCSKVLLLLSFFQAYLGPDFLLNNAQYMCSTLATNTFLCHLNIILLLNIFLGIAVHFAHIIYGTWNLLISAVLSAMVFWIIYIQKISSVDPRILLPSTKLNILLIILSGAYSFGWAQLPYIILMYRSTQQIIYNQYFLFEYFFTWWLSRFILAVVYHFSTQLWSFYSICLYISVMHLLACVTVIFHYFIS